jgi:hypothetical protein
LAVPEEVEVEVEVEPAELVFPHPMPVVVAARRMKMAIRGPEVATGLSYAFIRWSLGQLL